ncbi:hypothetical protein KFE25_003549 [Diacronema lutheri]|uniref:Uncharacterized protein n=2 Tax=Diacronema lutheri TaxID=2081491 RepID=A0A8J5X9U7_DIALT|nr:hypothetical protein KFE25_003549 [Diacronema lutheri]
MATRAFWLLIGVSTVRGWHAANVPRPAAALPLGALRARPAAVSLPSASASSPSAPRTLSDCERAFLRLYPKPVYPPYSGIVDELFSSLVLTLADSRFQYSRLFALGMYTILSQALAKPPSIERGVENRPTNEELAAAVCAALGLDWTTIERDGRAMLDWASGLSEAELFAIARGTGAAATAEVGAAAADSAPASAVQAEAEPRTAGGGGAGPFGAMRSLFARGTPGTADGAGAGGRASSGVGSAAREGAEELRALALNKYAFYHLSIGIALHALVMHCTVQSKPRRVALAELSTALGLKEAKVLREHDWWLGALERVHDSEERRLDDEVRTLQQVATKLQVEAAEARRLADEADGIASPPPPAEVAMAADPVEGGARADAGAAPEQPTPPAE